MKKTKVIIVLISASVFLFSYGNSISKNKTTGSPGDLRSNTNVRDVKVIKIGKQEWMVENLNVSNFRNGTPIPEAKTNEEWMKAYRESKPAWCYYNFDPKNGEKYGKLYNWYAVSDSVNGLAPAGWHIPSNEEWTQLTEYLGGYEQSGSKMKSANGWQNKGNGTNESGFSGLPGGFRRPNGNFESIGLYGYWWSSSQYITANAWDRILYYNSTAIRSNHHKASGLSVRCMKN